MADVKYYHAAIPGTSFVIKALWEDQAQDELDEFLEKQGIDPVPVRLVSPIGLGIVCFDVPAKRRKRKRQEAQAQT